MQDSKTKVKIQGQLTKATGMERGFRQGAALYTALISTVLEKVIRNKQTNPNGTI